MNILPKKKWHVRTKENVARVRRDQKRAREEEARVAKRAQLAEQEYKINLLRQNAGTMETIYRGGGSGIDDNNAQFTNPSHINLFADLEAEYQKNFGIGNRDYELEKKKEQEEYEKKVGILQYLGQGSSELTKEKPWYEKVPTKKESELRKSENRASAVGMFSKRVGSPCGKVEKKQHKRRYRNKEICYKKRKKKSRLRDYGLVEISSGEEKSSNLEEVSKKQKLERLRQERLDREEKERKRLTNLLMPSESNKQQKERSVAKYNSQFNPALARQN
ncbi:hypothetical protein LOAG_00704 [Loa loa]|nr:hypothetical protein LOAG_00704 [Loa loa]EFO27772.1 hypothetical protein LOAG_00704 [Loa loa]